MSAREHVLAELEALISKERSKLEDAIRRASGPLQRIVTEELMRAGDHLADLRSWAATGDHHELSARASYAFKRAINARTALLRHTPALEGAPHSMAADQPTGGTHLVDYARGGYVLELDGRFPEGVRFDDHPRLAALASSISSTLGRGAPWQSLLFSSGMGAINTVMDLAVERAGRQRLVLGAHSWIEVKEYAEHTYPGRFELVDESSPEAMSRALADPSVAAIFVEPLVNHPRAPVVPLEVFAGSISPGKLIVLDLALTPELGVASFLPNLPKGVTVALISSGVKFFQAGWDLSKAGLLEVCGGDDGEHEWARPYRQLITLRGRSGRVLSYEEAELADLETRQTFSARLARLDANTRSLAHALETALGARGVVTCPWLPTHPHHGRIGAIGTGGRFVYVRFSNDAMSAERLAGLDRSLARAATKQGVPLVVATTFGLSVPHVCLLAHPTEGLTLRLSPGSGDDVSAALAELMLGQLDPRAA
jgi:hypothetical protein